MQLQGELLKERNVFDSYTLQDMERANEKLAARLNTYQHLQLLCIVHKIKNIGA